jgi:hypothetical protein
LRNSRSAAASPFYRFFRNPGSVKNNNSTAVAAMKPPLIGRVKKTVGSARSAQEEQEAADAVGLEAHPVEAAVGSR